MLICDHATNRVPEGYGDLGVGAEQLSRHIGYDIGAAGVTERLSALLGAPAILSNFTRLFIDPNRGEDDPTLVMQLSDGAVVPGNAGISAEEIERRLAHFYAPYHAAIDAAIDEALEAGRPPVLLSIHTFTENWKGVGRPWHAGILWDKDPRLAVPLIEALSRDPALHVGDNEPYRGALRGDCMYKHGTRRGLAHALVEIRQDLVATEQGQAAWAERLAQVMRPFLNEETAPPGLHEIRHFGSHTD
ncbi:MAG: N-formylglutamate amidohydrolase [Methyloligellaceae bacterium]